MTMMFSAIEGGFFLPDSPNLPDDCVEISDDDHAAMLDGLDEGKLLQSDNAGRPVLADRDPPTLDELAASALTRINAGYTKSLADILSQYPSDEVLSFDKQEAQADAWWAWYDPEGNNQAGAEPATPYLDSMLETRPIGKAELVTRIRAKASAFSTEHGRATGRRQRLEDEVKAALEAGDRETLTTIKNKAW